MKWRIGFFVVLLLFSVVGCAKQKENVFSQEKGITVDVELVTEIENETEHEVETEIEDKAENETEQGAEQGAEQESSKNAKFEALIMRSATVCQNYPYQRTENLGILKDIMTLLWMVPRGGVGIVEQGLILESESELLAESQAFLKEHGEELNTECYTDQEDNGEVWIRLVGDAYLPEEGVNTLAHKDIILYTIGKDACFGVQDLQNEKEWTVWKMQDYGEWLRREVEIVERVTTGL